MKIAIICTEDFSITWSLEIFVKKLLLDNEVTVIYEGFFNKEGMDERIVDVIKKSAENFVPTILLEDKPFIEGCWQGILSGQTKYSLVKGKEIRQRWFLENIECLK